MDGHVAGMGIYIYINVYKRVVGEGEGKGDHQEDLVIDGRILLKFILGK
jgi:hypothetical protein